MMLRIWARVNRRWARQAYRLVRVLPGGSLSPVAIPVAVPARLYRPARGVVFIQELRQRMAMLPGFQPIWPPEPAV